MRTFDNTKAFAASLVDLFALEIYVNKWMSKRVSNWTIERENEWAIRRVNLWTIERVNDLFKFKRKMTFDIKMEKSGEKAKAEHTSQLFRRFLSQVWILSGRICVFFLIEFDFTPFGTTGVLFVFPHKIGQLTFLRQHFSIEISS